MPPKIGGGFAWFLYVYLMAIIYCRHCFPFSINHILRDFHAFPGSGIDLKLSWYINHGTPPWLNNVWSRSAEFPLFPYLWLVEQFPRICKPLVGLSSTLLDQLITGPCWPGRLGIFTVYWIPVVWRAYSVWEKPLIALSSNLVGEF